MDEVPVVEKRNLDLRGLLVSLVIAGVVLIQSSWFFAAICVMAGAMVVTGATGRWGDWAHWVGIVVGFTLFAGLRAAMGPMVEEDPLFIYAIQMETLGGLLPVSNVWLQDHFQAPVLDALSITVYLSFFLVPQAVVVYLWKAGGAFRRYVLAALALFASALLIHLVLPTAPPWMAAKAGLIPPLDRIIIRVLNTISPTLTAGGYEASANDVAAMPSVHQGLTVLATVALVAHRPKLKLVGWAYGLAMLFAIAYLGEHYLVDGAVGASMAWGAWWMAGRTLNRGREPHSHSGLSNGPLSITEGRTP
jgi:hypothetical protein